MKKIILLIPFLFITMKSIGQSGFSVRIDTRMEAVSIFYTLATVDTLDVKPTPSTYYKDFIRAFNGYKNHPSIKWYRNLNSWDGYDVSSIGLFLSHSYPFKLQSIPKINYIRSAPVDTFLFYLNKFYKDCHVDKFIKNHAYQYRQICRKAEDTITKCRILEAVEHFYGYRPAGNFIVYLDLLNNLGNNAIPAKDSLDIINRLAYLSGRNTSLTLDSPVVFVPHANVIAHECSHIYLRDFMNKYKSRLFKIRDHFLTTTKGKQLKEDEWKNEADELLVRVCVAKILEYRYGEKAGLAEINNQALHYKWAKRLYFMLNDYTRHRNRYRTLAEFYPRIIQFLENQTYR